MRSFLKQHYLVILITAILFVIPFFWIKPGEMDLGGDGNRLYYYDPLTYLINDGLYLYDNVIEGIRTIEPHYYNLPFVLLLLAIKTIVPSTYFVLAFINGIKLSLSFLSVFLIIVTLLKQHYKKEHNFRIHTAAIVGGLFYIVTPIMIGNYDKALLSQSQVFLNPLLFYLLLVYAIKQKFKYLVFAIIITVLFTPNFSWVSAPPFFSFFPLAFLFLIIYSRLIIKNTINVLHIIWGILLLIGLHAFHLLPEAYSLLNVGSYVNERVFNKDNMLQQLSYFHAILPLSKITYNIMEYASIKSFPWLSIIPLFIILLGLTVNRIKNKTILLTSIFFLITLFLVTANITHSGVKLYEFLFTVPGFSMFRNFIGQWAFVCAFFYALLFGQTLFIVLQKVKYVYIVIILALIISISLLSSAWQFFNGNLVNKVHFQSKDVKIAMTMDHDYEKTLDKIRSLKEEGAFISFPFTDCCYSVVHGKNDGAYVGTSPLTALTGRKDYNGYVTIAPFSEVFLKLVKEKDYESIKKLFGLLDIKYIYYNSDPKVYDETFSGYPYTTVRNYFPTSQKEYKLFVNNIAGKEVYTAGSYHIYQVDNRYTKPHVYSTDSLAIYKDNKNDWRGKTESFFIDRPATESAYTDYKTCLKIFSEKGCNTQKINLASNPKIVFKKINPTKYSVYVTDVDKSYLLTFSETFHNNWNIHLDTSEKSNILQRFKTPKNITDRHIMLNGYANGWYINPEDVKHQKNYTLIIEMSDQRIFYVGLFISIVTALISIAVGFFLSRR